jgi:hypothetical protein
MAIEKKSLDELKVLIKKIIKENLYYQDEIGQTGHYIISRDKQFKGFIELKDTHTTLNGEPVSMHISIDKLPELIEILKRAI